MICYMFGKWFFGWDYVTTFVAIILLSAADFYTVKNITGRLLVGLRWWVHIREDGSNDWQFESAPNARIPQIDSRIFWWSSYGASAIWLFFSTWCLLGFSFDWLLVCLVGLALTGANLVGYFKCSADAQKRLQATLTSGAMAGLSYIPGALPAIGTTMMGLFTAAATSAAAGAVAGGAAAAAASNGQAPRATAPAIGATAPPAGSSGMRGDVFGGASNGNLRDAGADNNPFGGGTPSSVASGGGRGGTGGRAGGTGTGNGGIDIDAFA